MVGDFDDSANALWSLYEKEAKGHDEATIQTLKDDMDAVLIFVRAHTYSTGVSIALMDGHIRLACFPLPSLHLSSIVLKTYNRIPSNNRRTSSNNLLCCFIRSPTSLLLSVHRSLTLPISRFQSLMSARRLLTSG